MIQIAKFLMRVGGPIRSLLDSHIGSVAILALKPTRFLRFSFPKVELPGERIGLSWGKIVVGISKNQLRVQGSIYRNWGNFYGKSLTLYRIYYFI